MKGTVSVLLFTIMMIYIISVDTRTVSSGTRTVSSGTRSTSSGSRSTSSGTCSTSSGTVIVVGLLLVRNSDDTTTHYAKVVGVKNITVCDKNVNTLIIDESNYGNTRYDITIDCIIQYIENMNYNCTVNDTTINSSITTFPVLKKVGIHKTKDVTLNVTITGTIPTDWANYIRVFLPEYTQKFCPELKRIVSLTDTLVIILIVPVVVITISIINCIMNVCCQEPLIQM